MVLHFIGIEKENEICQRFFSNVADHQLCYCNNVTGLLEKLHQPTSQSGWFLFLDSASQSFKAVLINKATLVVIPVAYTQETKETRALLKSVLEI